MGNLSCVQSDEYIRLEQEATQAYQLNKRLKEIRERLKKKNDKLEMRLSVGPMPRASQYEFQNPLEKPRVSQL